MHDGNKTPSGAGNAWDPTGSTTPAHNDSFDYDSTSPAPFISGTPNPHTPGYQSEEQSPANIYDNNPQTPGVAGYSSDRTFQSPFGNTPSPHTFDGKIHDIKIFISF